MTKYNTLNYCQFLIQFHIIWCPKFRYNVLEGDISNDLKEILWEITENYNYEIKALEVMPNHAHLFISTKPTVSMTEVVCTRKSIPAIELFKLNPRLRNFYSRADSLWSKGYFAITVGNVSEDQKKNN